MARRIPFIQPQVLWRGRSRATSSLWNPDDGLSGGCGSPRMARRRVRGFGDSRDSTGTSFRCWCRSTRDFWLECTGERLELFGVWPNLVRTPTLPTEGLEGQLVYGGDGSRLEGQPVAGRIVLLDYVSGTAWVDAFHLGAAAVVFLESAGAHRKEAEQKFLDVPADLPVGSMRAKMWRNVCGCWQGRRRRCDLWGRMTWREVNGAEFGRRDPWARCDAEGGGRFPRRALRRGVAGARVSAGGRAGCECGGEWLLELARGFAEFGEDVPPKRTVALLWTAGHFQNMAGMRHFAPLLLAAAGQREGEVEETALLPSDSVRWRRAFWWGWICRRTVRDLGRSGRENRIASASPRSRRRSPSGC